MSDVEMTPEAPRTNGVAKPAAPTPAAAAQTATTAALPYPALASSSSSSSSSSTRALPEICYILRRKVVAFLAERPDTKLLRDTQEQARVAMGVIEEALRRYGCVVFHSLTPILPRVRNPDGTPN